MKESFWMKMTLGELSQRARQKEGKSEDVLTSFSKKR